jgi:hypothetical protein
VLDYDTRHSKTTDHDDAHSRGSGVFDSAEHDEASEQTPAACSSSYNGNGEYLHSIDCHSTSASSDEDVEARFVAYYDGLQEEGVPADYRAERSQCSGSDEHAGATVCGDWIFDGEWWNTADGVSYHPGLRQYFSHGQRIYLKDDDKPAPDEQKLQQEWELKKYQFEYGTWAADSRADPTAANAQLTAINSCGSLIACTSGAGSQHTHVLTDGGTIGRSKSCSLHIARSALSRIHAKVCWQADLVCFVLLNCSRNNTYHNGKPVGADGVRLAVGDMLFLGRSSCLTVTQIRAGCEAHEAALALRHAERGQAYQAQATRAGVGRRRDAAHGQGKAGADDFDGEPLSGDEGGAGVAAARAAGVDGADNATYRDRAAERRSMHAESAECRQAEYRRRQEHAARQLTARQVREAKSRRRQAVEATLQAIDAGCFRDAATGLLPTLNHFEKKECVDTAVADTDWQERGAKMLKMMGWQEGQGLG